MNDYFPSFWPDSTSVALGVGDEAGSRPGLAVSKLLAAAGGSL